jgi:hypothetical protein
MDAEKQTTLPEAEIPINEMPAFYTKSNFFRVIHADGIYGGGAPTPGNITMSIFSHRAPFPEKTVNDAFGNEIPAKRVVKFGIENEIEVSIAMSLDTAKVMLHWLNSTIKNNEAAIQKIIEMQQKK